MVTSKSSHLIKDLLPCVMACLTNILWSLTSSCVQSLTIGSIVSYYATYLFINSLGMSQNQAAITSGGVTLLFLGGTATTIWTVERLGRRTVMLYGAIFCSIFMILFTIGLGVDTDSSLKLAVVSIFLFEFAFGASWCPLVWVYVVRFDL